MKKHVNLHVKSLERFFREFINEYEIFKFKSIKELRKFQEERLRDEFKIAAHLDVNRVDHRVLEFERTRCKLTDAAKKQNKSSWRNSRKKKRNLQSQEMDEQNGENVPPNEQLVEGLEENVQDMSLAGNQVDLTGDLSKYNAENVTT